jgi:hypothetical protein
MAIMMPWRWPIFGTLTFGAVLVGATTNAASECRLVEAVRSGERMLVCDGESERAHNRVLG